jgi:hypothetical protein
MSMAILKFMLALKTLSVTMQVCMSLYEIKNRQFVRKVSVCFEMKWPSPMHGISVFCHEMVKPHAWYQYVLS